MNKTAIKNYAVWARIQLIESAKQRAYEYEITENGENNPNLETVGGRLLSKVEKEQRRQLINQIRQKSGNRSRGGRPRGRCGGRGGLPGRGPVSSCPSTRLWGPLPLAQAAGAGRSQAHSRVKALPSGLLQALAWLCCSGCGFCSRLLFSTCGMVWDFLTLLWSKMTLEVLPAHPVWSPPCDFSLISLCP